MNSQKTLLAKVAGVFVVVFALGCITGVAVSSALRPGGAPSTFRDPDAYFDTLKRELDLNDDQSARVRSILEQTRAEYRKVCADARPRYDALREKARDSMRALLDSSQQQRFDSIVLREDCSTCPDRRN